MRPLAAVAALAVLLGTAPRAATRPAPKLAVVIVVDQMRADYVEHFRKDWTAGLKRLVSDGAWFQRAAYPYQGTWTCPGHATVATGAFPHRHGIIDNAWWDRATSSMVTCTTDDAVHDVGFGGAEHGGNSAAALRTPTLGDEMRGQKNSHVATVSLKARSAIMLAGHGGDSVVWLNDDLSGWTTSSAYGSDAEPAIRRFLAASAIDADYGKSWTRMLRPPAYLHPDDGLAENPPAGWTSTFPHPLTSTSGHPDGEYHVKWERSPFADEFLERLGASIVDDLRLGRHDAPDLFAISFSTPDLVGHRFGPKSQEIQDLYARLDKTIGALLDHLDAAVGRNQYVVALTADHGIPDIPEQMAKEGVDAGRLSVRSLSDVAERAAAAALGPGQHVARENSGEIYFRPGVYDRLRARPDALEAVVGALSAQPGVEHVFRSDDLLDAAKAATPLQRAAALSYVPGRSGDLIVAARPGWRFAPTGTTHGTANPDDQRVPIVLMGYGIRRGEYQEAATPADIAPTLASLVDVVLPHAEGRVLREAVAR